MSGGLATGADFLVVGRPLQGPQVRVLDFRFWSTSDGRRGNAAAAIDPEPSLEFPNNGQSKRGNQTPVLPRTHTRVGLGKFERSDENRNQHASRQKFRIVLIVGPVHLCRCSGYAVGCSG